jgi:hypothetical protein
MSHNNLGFVRPIMRLAAADGGRAAGVDAKLVMQNGVAHTSRVKTVPERLDDVNNGGANGRVSDGRNNKMLLELSSVTGRVPGMNVSAGVREWNGGLADGPTIFLKKANGGVEVVAVVQGNITVSGLRARKFTGNGDDESGVSEMEGQGVERERE